LERFDSAAKPYPADGGVNRTARQCGDRGKKLRSPVIASALRRAWALIDRAIDRLANVA
jgi:hypothetical protein